MEVVDLKIKGQLLKALSVEDIVSVHRSGQRDLLVTLTAEAFQSMNVDLAKINEIERIRGVVPCCAGDVRDEGQADFSSRFFGPAVTTRTPSRSPRALAFSSQWRQTPVGRLPRGARGGRPCDCGAARG